MWGGLEPECKLRKEIRQSEEHLIVGIDIAKDRHYAFFETATGETLLRRLVFSNDGGGFRKLQDQGEGAP
jgi:transposase